MGQIDPIPRLKFPTYEQLKSLDKNKEYEIILFVTGIENTYGRITINEDGKRQIIFDLVEDGYINKNDYTIIKSFDRKNYKTICYQAQRCYDDLYKALKNGNDCSWMWEFNE